MTLTWRFLVLAALLFWQGGFTFYAAVVVPVGSEILGSHLQQGFVTRTVTNYLNVAGLVALVVWGWDIAFTSDSSPRRRLLRGTLWTVLLLTLGVLARLHVRLDEFLDFESFQILDHARFRALHRWYLWISTVQWGGSLLLLAVTLQTWRSEDKRATRPPGLT
jgi:hypothetical protein